MNVMTWQNVKGILEDLTEDKSRIVSVLETPTKLIVNIQFEEDLTVAYLRDLYLMFGIDDNQAIISSYCPDSDCSGVMLNFRIMKELEPIG